MAKNTQGTRPTTETSDPLRTSPTSTTPGVTPTDAGSVGSVNVYETHRPCQHRQRVQVTIYQHRLAQARHPLVGLLVSLC
jgi:hypothetical protein